jgi:hypothetical protein
MNEYVLKVCKSSDSKWDATVSLSMNRENTGTNIKGSPVMVYVVKGAVFEGGTYEEAASFARKWAEEQSL